MKMLLLSIFLLAGTGINAQQDSLYTVYVDTKDTAGAFSMVEVEASFPGGLPEWKHFLLRTIDPNRAIKDVPRRTKSFRQTAMVQFIVCTDGSVCDIKVINDVLPSVRREAEEAIRKSGNWEPAQQNGRKVKAYKRQPITFVMQ